MISLYARDLIAISRLKGIGRKTLNSFMLNLPSDFSRDLLPMFVKSHSTKVIISDDDLAQAIEAADLQIKTAAESGHSIITFLDEIYPLSLKVISDFPPVLYCNGNISLLNQDCVAVIGTREPTAHGIVITNRMISWLAKEKFVVVSGLAKGIDSIAHKASLDNRIGTISVLAHGLEKVYPAENRGLLSEIVNSGGLVISEYCYNSYVAKSNFVERDRIQAALSKAVFLIQSGLKGGSLHASTAALNYSRFLVVVGQSKTDISNCEEKILANQVLLYGTTNEISELLKKNNIDFNRILRLYNKDNKNEIVENIKKVKYILDDKNSLI